MTEADVFKHSTPALYDRYMGPLLFAPYAEHRPCSGLEAPANQTPAA